MASEDAQQNELESTGANQSSETPSSGDNSSGNTEQASSLKTKLTSFFSTKSTLLNPYVWGFVVLVCISGGIIWYAQTSNEAVNIDSQDLSSSRINQEDFASLAAEQAEIDSTNKTLNVQANSVFDGTMLVRSSLEVQGKLRAGQELILNDMSVTGQATINNLDISQDLNVQGDTQLGTTSVQGGLTVNDDITVDGSGTFAGNLTANAIEAGNLSFSGNLRMNGQIITGGSQTDASPGNSAGSGGTVSVNGNTTAGSVNINTGGSSSSGILARVRFGEKYSGTPRVNVAPVGAAAGKLDWYVTRTTTGFKIGTASPARDGANYTFDYFVVE